MVRCLANERGCRQASSPLSSATARISRSLTRGFDALADQGGVERVVAGIEAQVGIRRDAQDPAAIGVRRRRRQRRHHRTFGDQPVDRTLAQRLVHPRVRPLVKPGVELELIVELVREHPPGLEAALDEVLQTLDDPLGLRVALARRSASRPAAARRSRRTPPSGAHGRRAGRTGGPRPTSRAAPPATTDSAGSRTTAPGSAWRTPTRWHRRASSPDRRRRPTPAGSGRGRPGSRPGLPEVELADLPRPIDRPLIGPRRHEQRPHVAQIVIDDRLAAIEPQRRDQLTDPLAGHLGVTAQQLVDLVLERIQLRPRSLAPVPRRRRRPQRRPDRVAAQPGPPRQLLDRNAADEMLASQIGPLLHADQPLPPSLDHQTERESPSLRTPPPAPEGVNIRPAEGGDFPAVWRRCSQLV